MNKEQTSYITIGIETTAHGFVVGKNNRIRTIKRMAYGYRNVDNLRIRILVD